MALGARPAAVWRLILTQGAKPVVIGSAVGVTAALLLASLAAAALSGVDFRDPADYAAVMAGVGTLALAAMLFPARRATRIEPTVALRTE
jgi:ABC-type lipoprotein release transport system permease subunit